MRTNIDINENLMSDAMTASGAATKKAAVEQGLKLLIQVKQQSVLQALRGKLLWEGDLEDMRTDS